jgi:hypothetical protein
LVVSWGRHKEVNSIREIVSKCTSAASNELGYIALTPNLVGGLERVCVITVTRCRIIVSRFSIEIPVVLEAEWTQLPLGGKLRTDVRGLFGSPTPSPRRLFAISREKSQVLQSLIRSTFFDGDPQFSWLSITKFSIG